MIYVLLYLLYLVICLGLGSLGKNKKFGFLGNFLLSVLLTPIVGLILLFAQDDRLPPGKEQQ